MNEQVLLTLPYKSINKFKYQRNITHKHVDKRKKKCSRVQDRSYFVLENRVFKYYITAKRKGVIK